MDIFEKQQLAESIKSVVKARWFFAATVFVQGLIIKAFVYTPLASTWQLTAILAASYLYNIIYWLYLRRPPEKMTDFWLKTIKALQVIIDALAISAILYLSGTVDKLVIVWYFVILMVGVSLYKKRGIALSTLLCSLLYSSLLMLEYYGFIAPAGGIRNFIPSYRNSEITAGRLIGFNSYLIAAAFFAWFLGNLFRVREKRLQDRTDDLIKKSEILTNQTQELTKTKDYLHEALSKSDKSRMELMDTKKQLEAKIRELEKYGEITTGREIKMIELKEKIRNLEDVVKDLQTQVSKQQQEQ